MKSALALGAVLACAFAMGVSCVKNPPPKSPKQDEITALWTQIRDWRREAGLPVEPRHEDVMRFYNTPMASAKPVCGADHTVPPTCSDVCSLADAICDNAEQICILADDLKDQWSADKCASAKASCRDAKQRCCTCSEPAKP